MSSSPPRSGPPSSSRIDFLALANHIFVLCSIGYVCGNFFRSIVGSSIDTQLSDAFANSLFFFLALLFVVDAVLYYACMFDGLLPLRRRRKASVQAEAPSSVEPEPTAERDTARDGEQHDERRPRSSSLTSISTTVTNHDGESTLLPTPTTDDFWHSHSDLDAVSSASYTLHTDTGTTSTTPVLSSVAPSSAVGATGGGAVDWAYRSLWPLTVDGLGEVLNIVASVIALLSSILPFLSVVSSDNSGAGDDFMRWQIVADNSSMFLWFLDAGVYFRAWRVALPKNHAGVRGWWQPRNWYMWANILNVLASAMYLVSAVYAAVGVRVTEWLLGNDDAAGDHYDTRQVQREQRTLALAGDVLYLACAVLFELAWLNDRREEYDEAQRRQRARINRMQRAQKEAEKRLDASAPHSADVAFPDPSTTAVASIAVLPDTAVSTVPTAEHRVDSHAKFARLPKLPKAKHRDESGHSSKASNGAQRAAVPVLRSDAPEPGAGAEKEKKKRTPREERARQREQKKAGGLGEVLLPTFDVAP